MSSNHGIIILGAGLGGLGMASRLSAAGISDFVILEKEPSLGGTWRDNIYPGAACDTESHLYCYSFLLHQDVSRIYARQPELLRYAHRIAADAGLEPHIRYGHTVVSADWNDATNRWEIGLADGQRLTCRVFIAAWGQLNRPSIPDFPDRESFAGIAFHSARWPRDLDLSGKRVASIGNAASAIQYIPEIAPNVQHLTVFQRSPNWILPRGDRAYRDEELSNYTSDANAVRASRAELFAWRETTFRRLLEGSEDADEIERAARRHALDQVSDPILRAKLVPDFPLGCKRVLRSDDYFPALMRENVTLETQSIARFVPQGILTTDGVLHQVDIIIYGTGFETQSFQGPVDVHGTRGKSLRTAWSAGAQAYLGMTVADFPNMFLIYGPNTNLGHNSILSMFEAQFGYIIAALQCLLATPEGVLDVRADVMQAYDDWVQQAMAGTAWSGSCTSWYKNAAGRIVNNWCSSVEAYQTLTETFQLSDYRPVAAGQ